ncbi:MAG: M20 family peptidase [Desulfobacteraceae bacterium]|nr:MAG: M20 family peptidase [Desulfobacteraceae bacterium]
MDELATYIAAREKDMLKLLEHLVNTDCGTYVKAGVDRVGDILAERLESLEFKVERSRQKQYGDHVIGHKPGTGMHRILFIGHMDTVFAEGTAKKRPFRMEGGRAYGPGVSDMKGGIVALLYALEALKEEAAQVYNRIVMDVVFNSDEEILSPTSRPIIEALARKAHTVCVFEPARPGGEYVIQRKGVGKYTMTISGRAAHAGAQPEQGRSAIEALARKTVALHALTDLAEGTTVNVGLIRGGERSNVVAESAYAEIDVRVPDAAAAARLDEQIHRIAGIPHVPDTTCRLTGGVLFPPMQQTPQMKRLFEAVQDAGRSIGIELRGIATGGGSDGNHAAQFAPTLDGMGPQGSGAHSDREQMVISTLTERSKVTALFLSKWPEVVGKIV